MIERKFVSENIKEFGIQEYIASMLSNVGYSHIKLQQTPLGEKIIIFASRPGLIVGRKGDTIKKLTKNIKKKFTLENPQIEISEVSQVNLDATIVAERIAATLERFGSQKFKGVGHKALTDVIDAGALGIEVIISGKIPGARAKSWRFYKGYLKKCGDVAVVGVKQAYAIARLKSGVVGIQVRIMPPDVKLPDTITLIDQTVESVKEEPAAEEPKKETKKRTRKNKPKKETAPEPAQPAEPEGEQS